MRQVCTNVMQALFSCAALKHSSKLSLSFVAYYWNISMLCCNDVSCTSSYVHLHTNIHPLSALAAIPITVTYPNQNFCSAVTATEEWEAGGYSTQMFADGQVCGAKARTASLMMECVATTAVPTETLQIGVPPESVVEVSTEH